MIAPITPPITPGIIIFLKRLKSTFLNFVCERALAPVVNISAKWTYAVV